jgi:hypothetical protein
MQGNESHKNEADPRFWLLSIIWQWSRMFHVAARRSVSACTMRGICRHEPSYRRHEPLGIALGWAHTKKALDDRRITSSPFRPDAVFMSADSPRITEKQTCQGRGRETFLAAGQLKAVSASRFERPAPRLVDSEWNKVWWRRCFPTEPL